MKKLTLAVVVVLLAVGCATTGTHERAQGQMSPAMPAVSGAPAVSMGGGGGSAILATNDHGAFSGGRAVTTEKAAGNPVEPAVKDTGAADRQPEKADITLKDKVAPLLKKGMPDGKDDDVLTGDAHSGEAGTNAKNPKVKGSHENVPEKMMKAMLTVQLLMKRGKGGEANEGFSNDSIQKVKNAVNDATADNGDANPSAQESLKQGIEKVQLLMKRGKGCVADEGFSGDSIKSVERAMSGPKGTGGHQETIRERAFQYTHRNVGRESCSGSKCRD